MGLGSALVNGVKTIVGKILYGVLSLVKPLAMTKTDADDKSDPFAFLIHLLNLATVGLFIALATIPNYITDTVVLQNDGSKSSQSLFNLHCKSGDSLDCSGRLMGVQAVTIITIVLAFFNMICIKRDWYNGAFWSSLYSFGASLTAFFLFFSFSNRPYWTDSDNVVHNQNDIKDGLFFALSVAGMAVSGTAFLAWTAFEVNFLDSDVTKKIPDTILTILDAANMILPPNGFTQKIRNIRFTKNTGEGVGVRNNSFEMQDLS